MIPRWIVLPNNHREYKHVEGDSFLPRRSPRRCYYGRRNNNRRSARAEVWEQERQNHYSCDNEGDYRALVEAPFAPVRKRKGAGAVAPGEPFLNVVDFYL